MISDERWDNFKQKFATELGFDQTPDYRSDFLGSQLFELVPAFAHQNNWHQYLPANAVERLKESDTHYETFTDIVRETAQHALGDTEPQPLDYYIVFEFTSSRFRGGSDFRAEDVRTGTTETGDAGGNSVYDNMTIIVTSINSRGLEDWYVYVVDDATEKFGEELSSMTEAAHLIIDAKLEPDQIIRDVAFTLEDNGMETPTVSGVEPPEHSVSIVSTDPHSRGYHYQIDSPPEIFGDNWGDPDLMNSCLIDEDIDGKLVGESAIGFWITTGVDW